MSPAVSKRQQRFFGAELKRRRAGKKTRTNMTEAQIEEFAATKTRHLPLKKKSTKAKRKKKK